MGASTIIVRHDSTSDVVSAVVVSDGTRRDLPIYDPPPEWANYAWEWGVYSPGAMRLAFDILTTVAPPELAAALAEELVEDELLVWNHAGVAMDCASLERWVVGAACKIYERGTVGAPGRGGRDERRCRCGEKAQG